MSRQSQVITKYVVEFIDLGEDAELPGAPHDSQFILESASPIALPDVGDQINLDDEVYWRVHSKCWYIADQGDGTCHWVTAVRLRDAGMELVEARRKRRSE